MEAATKHTLLTDKHQSRCPPQPDPFRDAGFIANSNAMCAITARYGENSAC